MKTVLAKISLYGCDILAFLLRKQLKLADSQERNETSTKGLPT
jgi:hypothetical protein